MYSRAPLLQLSYMPVSWIRLNWSLAALYPALVSSISLLSIENMTIVYSIVNEFSGSPSALCRFWLQLYDMSANVLGCCIGSSCSQPIYIVADCSPILWCLLVGWVAWIIWSNSDPSWLCMWLFIPCQLICCPSPWLVYFSFYMVLLFRPCGSLVVIAERCHSAWLLYLK